MRGWEFAAAGWEISDEHAAPNGDAVNAGWVAGSVKGREAGRCGLLTGNLEIRPLGREDVEAVAGLEEKIFGDRKSVV